MNFDRLNRWLTLVANLGVIAGILFLAYEIRQNTLVAKVAASNSLEENLYNMTVSVWSNPDFARVLRMGMEGDVQELGPDDQLRLSAFYQQVLRGWQNTYFQFLAGTLDESLWRAQENGLFRTFVADQGLQDFWQSNTDSLTPAFNDLVLSWRQRQESQLPFAVAPE